MIKIRKGTRKDIIESSNLLRKVYFKFCENEGTKKGIKEYLELNNPKINLERIKKSYNKSPLFFVVEENKKIIGIIRGDKSRVRNLFVDEKFQGKGIAKKLMNIFEKESKKQGSNEIKIRASLYAIKFYQKIGYKKTTGIRWITGLRFQPMRKKLK